MTEPEKYRWPNGELSGLLPGTEAIVEELRDSPDKAYPCAHGDGAPAVVICEVPRGCVALPGIETQPLCHHHWTSNGSFEGMDAVVDLSIDGVWSESFGVKPLYTIQRDTSSEHLELVLRDPGPEVS